MALSGLAAAIHALAVAPRARHSRLAAILSGVLGVISLGAAMVAALYGVTIAEEG